MIPTAWCPSCTCGWHKAIDAFDVTPPEPTCRNPQCQCHLAFWNSVDFDQLHESTKRRMWGDR